MRVAVAARRQGFEEVGSYLGVLRYIPYVEVSEIISKGEPYQSQHTASRSEIRVNVYCGCGTNSMISRKPTLHC